MRRAAPFALLGLIAAPVANAASYTASVLFSLSPPAGMSSASPSNQPETSAGGQVVGSGYNNLDHAVVWSGSGSPVDLSTDLATGLTKSYAVATDGDQQAGYGEGSTGAYSNHALLWSGSAGTVVDLNPVALPGITTSEVFGITSNQQVGYGTGSGIGYQDHAMEWSGSAASAVDLNPTDFAVSSSIAFGTDGMQQVGQGTPVTGSSPHAILWNNSAGSAIDLNPSALGFTSSAAYSVEQQQQVGEGLIPGVGQSDHALLWNGTAASAVDLNPTSIPSITASEALGTNGSKQVGFGFGVGVASQALVWSGTASSAVNLQTMLPANGTWINSYANSIDSSGDIFGVAQGTFNNVAGFFAVEWSPGQSSGATDIGMGHLNIAGGSLTALTAQVSQGYDGGSWLGSAGITSSAAASDSTHLTAVGIIQNNQGGSPVYSASNLFDGTAPGESDILIKYTYFGDTNLDGIVDGSDYSRIDAASLANASDPGSMTGWFNGDFNFDGVIDGSDYTLIDNAFNRQGPSLSAVIATAEIAESPGASVVPEPGGIAVASIVCFQLLGKRRSLRLRGLRGNRQSATTRSDCGAATAK